MNQLYKDMRIRSLGNKRPWCAEVTGLRSYWTDVRTPVYDIYGDEVLYYETSKEKKIGFNRDFNMKASVTRNRDGVFTVTFNGNGIFEIRGFSRDNEPCSIIVIVDRGTIKQCHPFPDNWGEYMRENRISYEEVWREAWDNLNEQLHRLKQRRRFVVTRSEEEE